MGYQLPACIGASPTAPRPIPPTWWPADHDETVSTQAGWWQVCSEHVPGHIPHTALPENASPEGRA